MISLCETCGKEAVYLCKCRNLKFCKPHMARHKAEPGNHQVITISETPGGPKKLGKKSVSFNRNDSSQRSDMSKAGNTVSEKEVKKLTVRSTLEREMNKIIKFREDTVECLDLQQENYIRKIIAETKSISSTLLQEIAAKEDLITAALSELEKPTDIPIGNPIIERVREIKEPEDALVQCSGDVKEIHFEIKDFMSIEMG